jgi:hypothetical protein
MAQLKEIAMEREVVRGNKNDGEGGREEGHEEVWERNNSL